MLAVGRFRLGALMSPASRMTRPSSMLQRGIQRNLMIREARVGVSGILFRSRMYSTAPRSAPGSEEGEMTLEKSERAHKASQVNLAAKLSKKDSTAGSTGKEIMRLLRLAKREKFPLAMAILCLLISSAVTVSLPTMIGRILDAANGTDKEDEERTVFGFPLKVFFAGLAGIFVIGGIANYGRVVLLRTTGERLVARLRSQLYRRTISQDAEFFDANRVGDLISRLSSDVNIVAKSITQNVSDGLRSTLQCSAAIGMMCYTSLQLTSVIGLIVPAAVAGSYWYGRRLRKLSRDLQKAIGSMTKVSEERLSNIRTAQSFAGEGIEMRLYNDKIRNVFSIGKKEAIAAGLYFGTSGVIGNITILAMLGLGSGMVANGSMTVGELTTFTMYAGYAGISAYGLASFYGELMKGVGAASRVFELLDREPPIKATKGMPVPHARETITFENVKFAYPTRPAVNIFEGVNFTIPPGSNVCIVGPSGGGKSTITSLLLRFYDPTAGSIKLGDTDIRDFNLKSLRRHIGVVSQEPVLFSGTIAQNIQYGSPHATRQEIVQAAVRANCSFISDFPDGLDTFVGARGAQLSGGQKQRIAIARALIKNPSILILDEATSALDVESETLVNETLAKVMQENSTTISIAHRLSTIQRSEFVIVLSTDGTVAEHGRFAELYMDPNSALSKLLKQNENAPVKPPTKVELPPPEEELDQEDEEYQDEPSNDNKNSNKL